MHVMCPASLNTYAFPSVVIGVGISALVALPSFDQRGADFVISPLPSTLTAVRSAPRPCGTTATPSLTEGDAIVRQFPSSFGLNPPHSHSSLPFAASCP